MPFDLSLFDLITPYILRGDSFGAWHAALSTLLVREHEISLDDAGVVIRGIVSLEGDARPWLDVSRMTMGIQAENTEGHPQNDASRRAPWIDIRDARIEFELTVPRTASQKVAQAVAAIGAAPAFAGSAAVLAAYDADPTDAPPSDYPTTEFVLDLLLTTIVLRPPFLRGAKREADGQLVPDPQHEQVSFTLPRIKVRLSQGSAANDPLVATILSLGASGLDDPGDIGVAELIRMDPPYAFIGPSNTVGFGFRSGILDLSDGSTPPDVLAQFGFDESWKGLYLPELRLFVAPNGARDLAVDAGARNLLISFGDDGLTGDFELTVLDQGAGPLRLGARFYDAQGRGYSITRESDTTARTQLPDRTRMVVDVEGGRTPFNVTVSFDSGAPQAGREFDVDLTSQTTRLIEIHATDTSSPQKSATLSIQVSRRPVPQLPPPGAGPQPQPPPVEVETTTITQGGAPVQAPRLRLVSETPTTATVALDVDPTRAAQTQWTVNGNPAGTQSALTVTVAPGTQVSVRAELPGVTAVSEFTGYYRFDRPEPGADSQTRAYALNPDNTHTQPSPDEGLNSPWMGGTDVVSALRPILQSLPPGAGITIKGYASFEGDASEQKRIYNTDLARRRALGLRAIIEQLEQEPGLQSKNFNLTHAPEMTNWTNQGFPDVSTRRIWWKAVASWPPTSTPGTITNGIVRRQAVQVPPIPPPIRVQDPPPPAPPSPPSWFRMLGAKVRIVRNTFVACEVFGKFDIQTAAENRLAGHLGPNPQLPPGQPLGSANTGDGLIDIRIVVQIDDATDTVSVIGYFGADPADIDGLYLWGTLPNQTPTPDPGFARNFFGTAIVFMPLLSATAGAVANEGALTELAVTGAMLAIPAAIAGLGWVKVERVIWYGGEIAVRVRPTGPEITILLDLETALSLDLRIGGLRLVEISRTAPLAVRYKAVGIRLGYEPGQPAFQFRPIFDASKGYTIDVSRPGAIQVADPLGQILQILGARIARNNPLLFEVDLGFSVDLGVVSIERARLRMPLDPIGPPQLTAFAAGVDIPGALRGRGYLELNEIEIKGALDLTIVPVQVRIAAGIGIANIPPAQGGPATGVIVTLEVEFPVAIPLGNSGLGIYGFLGLFAVNYSRNEDAVPASNMAPALAWLKATGGEPTRLEFWKPRVNTWAFGVGAILGTMGSSIIFNLKGVFLLELPGPRLLLMMKANVLIPMPQLKGTGEGLILAVIDLDMGRGTLTIGLFIDFKVEPLLQIRIPVEAFFNFNDVKDWHLYLGRYQDPIHAKIFEVFEGSAYLMLSGSGISGIPKLPAVTGFSIATGLHVSIVWGSKSIGLYAELAAGFDSIVGFSPFRVAGVVYVRGSLHLFILGISAWAELRADLGEDSSGAKIARIEGEICGRIELLFFSIEGCIGFALGASSVLVPDPPKLATGLKLVSRSPALVVGTGTDKAIDGGIGDAKEAALEPANGLPVVPIDAIPVLMMAFPPLQDAALTFKGQALNGTPEAPADGWIPRGDVFYKYTVKQVDLSGSLTVGQTPATWWKQKSGDRPLEAQLALLSWLPEPTPKAVERSQFLEETVKETWGTVCWPAAAPAPILWTFLREPLGPSPIGWILEGEAWPDAPNTVRSAPPDLVLKVTERWRCGDFSTDALTGIIPAQVEGIAVPCPRRDQPPTGAASPPSATAPSPATVGLTPAAAAFAERVTALTTAALPAASRPDVIAAARGRRIPELIADDQTTLIDAIRRANSGMAISRSALALALTPAPLQNAIPGTAAPSGRCSSRMLAAPVFDSRPLQPFGGRQRLKQIEDGWKRRRFKPGPFDDAIVFHTGQVQYARFYLLVHNRVLEARSLVVAALDVKESILAQRLVTPADMVPPNSFPSPWMDPAGPWRDEIELLIHQQNQLSHPGYIVVVVEFFAPAQTHILQVGLTPQEPQWHRVISGRPFYVAAIEALRTAELLRFDYDKKEQEKKQGVLETVLGPESADFALLLPNTVYGVTLTWDASRERRPPNQPPTDQKSVSNQTQKFWFRTDADPPHRLDPWMLCTIPDEAEKHFFTEEPLKLIFGTNNVVRIWDAYDKRLQVRIRASSARPTPSTPSVPHPFPLSASTVKAVPASVLAPWEAVVQDLMRDSCVPVSGERTRHSMVTLPIPLEPFTDYILDIEVLPKSAPDSASGPSIWRRSFSTGAFPTLAEFAQSFAIVALQHRYAAPGSLQAVGAQFASAPPQGGQLDQALINAGLEPLPVPKSPRVVVFWQTDSPNPQPAAVLIDSSEPMWRARALPRELTDPGPAAAKRFELVPVEWLTLAEQPGGDPVVDHIVRAPGGQRALVTLKPGARGKRLRLALKRLAQKEPYLDGPAATDQFFTVADLIFTRAPWEED
jgi:hypothetical protein